MVIVRSFTLERDAPHDEVVKFKIAAETYFEADLKRYVVLGWHIAPSWELELEDGMHLYKYRGRPIVQVDSNGDPVERMP
jgi:hypothetical protein